MLHRRHPRARLLRRRKAPAAEHAGKRLLNLWDAIELLRDLISTAEFLVEAADPLSPGYVLEFERRRLRERMEEAKHFLKNVDRAEEQFLKNATRGR